MTAEWYRDADDVRDILDVAGIDQAFVVGSSRGARVALEVASLYPERVAKLALVCPAFRFGAPSPRMRAFIESEAALLALGDLDAAAELNARTWLGPDAGPAARQLVTQMQKRIYELRADEPRCAPHVPVVELATIKAPTTIISGGRDLDHFRWVATHLASQIQRSELRHLSWAGHLPTLERPSESGVLLQELLAQ